MRELDRANLSPRPRQKPSPILVLGISRTGTTSLREALAQLGYKKTFHMFELIANPNLFFPVFKEAIRAKFGTDSAIQPYSSADFDKIFADYDAISDLPAVLFSKELLEAYPDAKVILTTRDPDAWVESMRSTIYFIHSWWSWDYLVPFHSVVRGWRTCDTMDWDAFINSSPDKPALTPSRRDYLTSEYRALAIKRFNEHNAWVRSVVPPERLLEFRPQMGYKPLCEFLGKEPPSREYPRIMDKHELVRTAWGIWIASIASMLAQVVGPFVLAGGVAWWWRRA